MKALLLAAAATALVGTYALVSGHMPARSSLPTEASGELAPQIPSSPPADHGVASESVFSFGQAGKVTLYRPVGTAKGVVIFLSGDGGWNLGVVNMARRIAGEGAVVAGISTPALLKSLEGDSSACINPNFALRALAQEVEHRAGLANYVHPIIGGYSSGATVAFATLAQSPANIWRGGVSLGFGPDQAGHKPWCAAPGFTATPITKPEKGWWFDAQRLSSPWIVLQGLKDEVVDPAVTRSFVARYPNARLIELPKVGHGFSVDANWMPQFREAFAAFLDAGNKSVADGTMPITAEVDPDAPDTSTMAIFYSGDGGWADLDQNVAKLLAARGIPVIGVDSLRYFWSARTPQGLGQDLGQLIAQWSPRLNRPKVMVLGYSFGADAAPFAIANLPASQRQQVTRVGLLGLSSQADMAFHLASWLDYSGPDSLPTVPAVTALAKQYDLICLRGKVEQDSACPTIPAGLAKQVVLPGGHHFDGRADLITNSLLAGLET